jgi:cysteine desulfurase
VLFSLDFLQGVCVSAGSACYSGTKKPSRILKAIGLSDEDAFSTIRISVGEDTTIEECNEFVRILGECLESLKMIE